MNSTNLIILLCIYTGNDIPLSISYNIYCEIVNELLDEELIQHQSNPTSGYSITNKGNDFLNKLYNIK